MPSLRNSHAHFNGYLGDLLPAPDPIPVRYPRDPETHRLESLGFSAETAANLSRSGAGGRLIADLAPIKGALQ